MKRAIALLLAGALLTGCSLTEENNEQIIPEPANEEASKTTENIEINNSNEDTSKDNESGNDSASQEQSEIPPKTGMTTTIRDIPDLTDFPTYDAFLKGNAKAHFADPSSYRIKDLEDMDLSADYTLQELIEAFENTSFALDGTNDAHVDARLMDCGKDGAKELAVDVAFTGSMYDDHVIEFILKDTGDGLTIGYFKENVFRNEEAVSLDGAVSPAGAASHDIWGGDYGYLDADLKWHYLYTEYYYLEISGYANSLESSGIKLDVSGDEWKEIQATQYAFEENPAERTWYTIYTLCNDKGDHKDLSIYDQGSFYKNAFDAAGIATYSPYEIKELMVKNILGGEKLPLTAEDVTVTYNGNTFGPNTGWKEIVDALGYPELYEESNYGFVSAEAGYRWALCYPEAMASDYGFEAVLVNDDMEREGPATYIDFYILNTTPTARGIQVGDSIVLLKEKYGEPDSIEPFYNIPDWCYVTYNAGNAKLKFAINKDNEVFSITIDW